MTANNANDPERSTVQLLQEINSGMTDPKSLDKYSRQQCVELLIAEGYTYAHISQVLKCSEKTISRDIKNIRERNALMPNVEFAKQFIGETFKKAMNHHSFLMRTARSPGISASEKTNAEYAAWRILKEIVEVLQSLFYLPNAKVGEHSHQIIAEGGGEETVEAKKMLLEIESIAKDTDTYSEELGQEIKLLSMRIEKAEVAEETKNLLHKQKEAIEKKEQQNEK
jgi:hypothetical protein